MFAEVQYLKGLYVQIFCFCGVHGNGILQGHVKHHGGIAVGVGVGNVHPARRITAVGDDLHGKACFLVQPVGQRDDAAAQLLIFFIGEVEVFGDGPFVRGGVHFAQDIVYGFFPLQLHIFMVAGGTQIAAGQYPFPCVHQKLYAGGVVGALLGIAFRPAEGVGTFYILVCFLGNLAVGALAFDDGFDGVAVFVQCFLSGAVFVIAREEGIHTGLGSGGLYGGFGYGDGYDHHGEDGHQTDDEGQQLMLGIGGLLLHIDLALGDIAPTLEVCENQPQPSDFRNCGDCRCCQKQGGGHGEATVYSFQHRKQGHQQRQREEGLSAVLGCQLRILYIRGCGQGGFVLGLEDVQLAPVVGIARDLPLGDIAHTVVILVVNVFFEGGEDPVHFYKAISCQRLLVQPFLNGADVILLIGEKFTHGFMLLFAVIMQTVYHKNGKW